MLLAALASVLAATAAAQVGGAAGAKVHPRTSDILYIECQVYPPGHVVERMYCLACVRLGCPILPPPPEPLRRSSCAFAAHASASLRRRPCTQVCELLAKNAWRQVRELMKSASPTNKAS